MSEGKLETAVLGLNETGGLLLEAASATGDYQVVAVADKDTNLAEKVAAQHGCEHYDDYRQLVNGMATRLGEDDIGVLLVAAPMYTCDEYVRMALKKGFHVLKVAPPARNFEEAAELVRLAEEQKVTFAVANPGRFADSFVALREFLAGGGIDDAFLVSGVCSYAGQDRPKWQSDPELAGGGVLLHNCYAVVAELMRNFPLPQHVYSLSTNQAQDKQQRLYLTEDTAVVAMKFSDTLVGNLVVSGRRSVQPEEEFAKVCGKDKMAVVDCRSLRVLDVEGKVVEEAEFADGTVERIRKVVEDFAEGILRPEEKERGRGAREDLKTMAVIEAAYLSARTGMPESPGKIMQMAQFEPEDVEGDRA